MHFLKKLLEPQLLFALFLFIASGVSWYTNSNYTNQMQNDRITSLQRDVDDLKMAKNKTDIDMALLQQNVQQLLQSQENVNKKLDILLDRKQ
jgi:hypothetical protein